MLKKKKDITGKRFGNLVALYPISEPMGSYGSSVWKCRCDCGREINVMYYSLLSGNNKSCGCLKEKSQKDLVDRLELVDGTCIEWLGGRRKRSDNKSGCSGVFRKRNGNYSASIGFKKKLIYLGTYKSCEEAVEARKKAEDMIFGSFLEGYKYWKERAAEDPEWAQKHPFRFDVKKNQGRIVIDNPMKEFLDQQEV